MSSSAAVHVTRQFTLRAAAGAGATCLGGAGRAASVPVEAGSLALSNGSVRSLKGPVEVSSTDLARSLQASSAALGDSKVMTQLLIG
mmetsp:Transcript_13201/g.43991  ORF Transcript_13201/g.43991 Transcript_13201/m.43991 type:complete len:87 (-) Transcript_13201:209-469(-)